MKVLVLYQHIDSGAKVATDALLECLHSDYPENTYDVYRQASHRFSGRFSFLGNLLWSILDFRNRINAASDIDIIYTTVYVAIVAQFISNKRVIPSIFHLHGDHRFGELKRTLHPLFFIQAIYAAVLARTVLWLQHFAIQRSSKTLFVSESAKQEFIERYNLKSLLFKFNTIYNGVSLKRYTVTTAKRKVMLKKKYNIQDIFVVSYLGRIDEKKGIHHLIEAAQYLTQPTAILVIYPRTKDRHSHSYLEDLKKKAAQSPLTVRFIEQPSHVEELYHLTDCVVLPSEQEMLPLVLLESLASGVPFLSTPVGGIPEILYPFPEFLLQSVQPKHIARQINNVLKMEPSAKEILQQKERTLATTYSWENSAKQLHFIFSELTQYQR